MSRGRSYRCRNSFGGQFAGRLIAMLESPAFRVLSQTGHRILARVEIELAKNAGENNGKLPVTYEQFVEYGIHPHAIAPGIRECEALGFLEAERGQAGNREYRWPSTYRLTYRPVGLARSTDEWRRIKTTEEAEVIARAARKTSAGKRQVFGDGNHLQKLDFSVMDSVTSVSVPESITTSRFSGPISALRAGVRAASPKAERSAPAGHRSRAHAKAQGVRGKPPSPAR